MASLNKVALLGRVGKDPEIRATNTGKEIADFDKIKLRFLSHVIVLGEDSCWLWNGATKGNGYGNVTYNRKNTTAHRLSYKLFVGEVPGNFDVCHKCDNRKCVNPRHLFIGTRKDNMQDAVKKGRQAKGDKLLQTKIFDSQKPRLMEMVNKGILYSVIAKEFNVTPQLIGKIAIKNGVRRYA